MSVLVIVLLVIWGVCTVGYLILTELYAREISRRADELAEWTSRWKGSR